MEKYWIILMVCLVTIGANAKRGELDIFKKIKTGISNPLEMRDPFKKKMIRFKRQKRTFKGFFKDSSYSNRSSLGGISLNNIRIVGVYLGKKRRAIAKKLEGDALSKDSYILREGMKLGANNAEIRAILPGGIILVEKIKNVYDQEEYIETVLPVQ